MTMQTDSMRFKPRIMMRDATDLCILFGVAPIQFLALFGLPAFVTFLLSRSLFLAFAAIVIVLATFIAFSVWDVTLTQEGVRFNRLLGGPKYLPWSAISSVEIASRRELICQGWLWPLLPAREMTPSLTSLLHYRIRWATGFCYFPPADPKAFEDYVEVHLRRPVSESPS